MIGMVLSVAGSTVRSLTVSAFSSPESFMLLNTAFTGGDVGRALGQDRAVLVGPAGLVELRDHVELAVGAGRFTEVDRGVDEHRVDLLGLERGVRVGEVAGTCAGC